VKAVVFVFVSGDLNRHNFYRGDVFPLVISGDDRATVLSQDLRAQEKQDKYCEAVSV
jgi:hypothetical protein